MPKNKTLFVCQSCGTQSPKWQGQCFGCNEWNTLVEEVISKTEAIADSHQWLSTDKPQALALREITEVVEKPRHQTSLTEMNRVLGGGFIEGSYILLGGEPGIGKSTLLLQMLENFKFQALYISGEESAHQTATRAKRLNIQNKNLKIASEGNLENILELVNKHKPQLLIVDSIQTVYLPELNSAPGTVSQVRESAARLMKLAKAKGITVFVVGHITKDGSLAGPKVLEHIVDTVLSFEGDGQNQFRLLRTLKNRFGPANELGVFQMVDRGLEEVPNPSELFLSERSENSLGSVVFCAFEGSRPLLCEVQALNSYTPMAMPRRTAVGIDVNRLHLILAVLDKHLKVDFSKNDVFVNVAGGLKITETASDLAVAVALLSSFRGVQPPQGCFFGEISLTGDIRGCPFVEERVQEAYKLGFKTAVLPLSTKKRVTNKGMKYVWVRHVKELPKLFEETLLFGTI